MRVIAGFVALAFLLLFPEIDSHAQSPAANLYVVVLATVANTAQRPATPLPEGFRDKSVFWRRVKSGDAVSYQLALGFFDSRGDAERAQQQLAASFREARVFSVSPTERENVLKAQQRAAPIAAAPPAQEISLALPPPAAAAIVVTPAPPEPDISRAFSPPAADTNFYLYGALGLTTADQGIDKAQNDADLRSLGATNLTSEASNDSVGGKVLFGVMLSPNFAIELGYVSAGTSTYRATFAQGTAKLDAKADGFVIALVAMAPVSNRISVFGKVGSINATVKVSGSITGLGSFSDTDTHWAPNFGGGLMIRATDTLSVRVELERFSNLGNADTTGESDVTMLSAGALIRF